MGVLGPLEELHSLSLPWCRLTWSQHLFQLIAISWMRGAPGHAHLHKGIRAWRRDEVLHYLPTEIFELSSFLKSLQQSQFYLNSNWVSWDKWECCFRANMYCLFKCNKSHLDPGLIKNTAAVIKGLSAAASLRAAQEQKRVWMCTCIRSCDCTRTVWHAKNMMNV